MVIHTHYYIQTWVELKMVNSQANTVVLRLMVRIPNTQVSPNRGSRMRMAFKVVLSKDEDIIIYALIVCMLLH